MKFGKNTASETVLSFVGEGLKLAGLCFTIRYAYERFSDNRKDTPKSNISRHELLASPSSKYKIDFETLDNIMEFWFANSPSESNSKLWMIPNESTLKRRRIDAQISLKFSKCVEDISNNFDDFICEIEKISVLAIALHYQVAAVIALDQLSRHIKRYLNETEEHGMPIIDDIFPFQLSLNQKQIDILSVRLSKAIVDRNECVIRTGRIPLSMYVFILMPFRHENKINSISFVQQCIDERDKLEEQHSTLLKRFRNATNRRMTILQDITRKECNTSQDKTSWSDDDIVEVHPFDSDMKNANEHDAVITLKNFLSSRKIRALNDTNEKPYPLIVSLSGGVDSMVIVGVLVFLKRVENLNVNIIAVHINYANRPESGAEANYVMRYCEQMNVEYRCRVIKEVTRGVTARDEYEKVARKVRYDMYKSVQNEFKFDNIKPPVLLGHHRGDLRENVLSNSMKGSGPLELSGMTEQGYVEKVLIWRPLLTLEKETIFDYAHKYGVPYFKDTTPLWSTRGKLRNKLLPLLCEVYGEGSLYNLSNLAVQSDAARDLFLTSLAPFFQEVITFPLGLSFDASPYKHHTLFFWRFVLRKILHEHGRGMFTDKSVLSFIDRISTARAGWLQCRKDYAVYLRSDLRVFIFHPESFPFHARDQYKSKKSQVCIDGDSCIIGTWIITATKDKKIQEMRDSERLQYMNNKLNQKPFESLDDFMQGSFHYYIEVPVNINTLEVIDGGVTFSKPSRPTAWKNIDPKIESSMPLVPRFTKDDTQNDKVTNIVKLQYRLKNVQVNV